MSWRQASNVRKTSLFSYFNLHSSQCIANSEASVPSPSGLQCHCSQYGHYLNFHHMSSPRGPQWTARMVASRRPHIVRLQFRIPRRRQVDRRLSCRDANPPSNAHPSPDHTRNPLRVRLHRWQQNRVRQDGCVRRAHSPEVGRRRLRHICADINANQVGGRGAISRIIC